MSEMVERVTHAVFDSINSEMVDYCTLEVARQVARAAIEALRSPSLGLIGRLRDQMNYMNDYRAGDDCALNVWNLLIDEMLK